MAALIDARLFERIRRVQERFDALCDRLDRSYADVPEDLASAEIEKAGALARRETVDTWWAAGRLPALPAAEAGPTTASKRDASVRSATAKPASKARR